MLLPYALPGPEPARRPGDGRERPRDRGISTIEVVILAPVMMLFILLLVAFGQLVDGRGGIDGAARDAVRAATLQRELGDAQAAAQEVAESQLEDVCTGPVTVDVEGNFAPPELGDPPNIITAEVSCDVKGLEMLGLNVNPNMQGSATASLDPFRRAA